MEHIKSRRIFSIVFLAYTLMFVVSNLSSVGIEYIANLKFERFASSELFFWLSYSLTMYIFGGLVFVAVMHFVPDSEPIAEKSVSAKDLLMLAVISISVCYTFSLVGASINHLLELIKGGDVRNPLESVADSPIVYLIIFPGILSPIFEEYVFRGVLIKKLRRYGDSVCIIVSSAIFATYHANFSQFFYAFALGALFSYTVLKTGRIRYSIALHMLINLLGSVLIPHLALLDKYIIVLAIDLFVFATIISGFFLFFSNYKRISLCKGTSDLLSREAVFNVGFLCYAVMIIVSFYISIILC